MSLPTGLSLNRMCDYSGVNLPVVYFDKHVKPILAKPLLKFTGGLANLA